jgi:polyphosphate:AMP phosphotransferase
MAMGAAINHLLLPLDPRGFVYHNITAPQGIEKQMPFMWRFWIVTPWKGSITILDRSWYSRAVSECLRGSKCKVMPSEVIDDINRFEKYLADDGVTIIKIFLHTSLDNLPRRSSKKSDAQEACGLMLEDLDSERLYKKHLPLLELMVEKTDSPQAPWIIIEADDPEYAEVTMFQNLVDRLEAALGSAQDVDPVPAPLLHASSPREAANLTLRVVDEEYKEKLSKCQARLRDVQCRLFKKKRRLVIVYEGRDAAGKGGDIARLTQTLNPRTYQVVPTGAPDDMELAHHYLWRFQRRLPLPGHMSIFDRSWYGRVLVERVNGLVDEKVWRRAYQEINDFEQWLVANDTTIIKIWLEVDKRIQLQRFIEREEDPTKMWKITPDDWAARERWDAYTEAIDEMLARTSTAYAPWTVVPSNDKNYSRIETLRTIVETVETDLDR